MSSDNTSVRSSGGSGWMTYENGILLLMGFTFGLVFFDRNTINFLASSSDMMGDLGLDNANLGLLNSALAAAWALSAYFIGAWSDHLGTRKPFVLLTIIVFSLCSALSGIATSLAMLLAARIIMGIAEGPFLPVCLSIMNVESSPHRRGVNAGIMQNVFAALVGTTLAGFLVPRLAAQFDWRITFFLTGTPGLICAALVWIYLKEPKREPVPSDHPTHDFFRSALAMLKEHNIRVCCLISIFMVAWFLVVLTFLPLFLAQYRGATETQAGDLPGIMALSTALCGFLVPAFSDRIGRKPALIIFCFMGLVTPLGALFFKGPLSIMTVLLFIGWSGTGAFPIFMGVVPGETVSKSLATSSMGLVVCVGELIGGVTMPIVAGKIADHTSLVATMVVAAICALLGGICAFWIKETAPKKVASAVVEAASTVTTP